MEKALKMGNVSATGSFQLFIGQTTSTIAAITTYSFLNFINAVDWIELTTGGIIFLAAYVLAAPIIGAINQSDINNLRAMLSGLGIISKLINIPLALAERVANLHFIKRK